MKFISLLLICVTGALLIYAANDMPDWRDPHSPASKHLSPHYIEKTFEETSVPNLVTAVLADYRGFDTMLETIVIFSAGLAIMLLLGASGRAIYQEEDADMPLPVPVRKDLIVQSACRLLLPVMQIFAFYVVAHGHHSPGGGFQGGVILGASLIFLAVAYNLKTALKSLGERRWVLLATVGVLIYSGVGFGCLLLSENFLNYEAMAKILPITPVYAHSLGMLLVEIGVAFTVTTIMFAIYAELSSYGKLRRGV